MNLNPIPVLGSFAEIGTTESVIMTSGAVASDTRVVNRFRVVQTTRPFNVDLGNDFTPKEIAEIQRSFIDLKLGNYKTFDDTDDLFAYLDRK